MATKILVVDDERCIRDIITFTMSEYDCDIVCAGSLSEAIEICRTSRFSIAFIDVVLPDGQGIDLVDILAQRFPDLPCCILTGHPDKFSKIRSEYMAKGTNLRIMLKPIWPDQILEAARTLMEKGSNADYCNVDDNVDDSTVAVENSK